MPATSTLESSSPSSATTVTWAMVHLTTPTCEEAPPQSRAPLGRPPSRPPDR